MPKRKVINGGPAFPFQITIPFGSINPFTGQKAGTIETEVMPGMDARDVIAALLMQAMIRDATDIRAMVTKAYDVAEMALDERATRRVHMAEIQ